MHHPAWLIFVFSVEAGICHVGQAGLELLASSEPHALASQNDGIIGVLCFKEIKENSYSSVCFLTYLPLLVLFIPSCRSEFSSGIISLSLKRILYHFLSSWPSGKDFAQLCLL